MRKYLALDGWFEGTRMFSAATSAAYLLSKGLPLEGIAQLKMIQSAASFLLEFPTGVIADVLGRRNSLLISTLAGLTAFLLYSQGSHFLSFALAEVSLSLCLCFWSGAYEAYSIDSAGLGSHSAQINRFFHLNSAINTACILGAGFVGAWLAKWNSSTPFLLAAAGFALLGIWLFLAFPRDQRVSNQGVKSQRRSLCSMTIKLVISSLKIAISPELLPYFAVITVTQALVQPLIYYWQPWFEFFGGPKDTSLLGFVFVGFQLAILLTSSFCSKFSKQPWMQGHGVRVGSAGGFCLSIMAMALWQAQGFALNLILFCCAESFYTVFLTAFKAEMNVRIPSEIRASVMSSLSVVCRMGSLVTLSFVSFYLTHVKTGLGTVFVASGISGILILIGWRIMTGINSLKFGVTQEGQNVSLVH